jgi:hypothetical protein
MNSRAVAALNAAAAFRLRAKDAATRPELKRVALSACRYAQASTVCFGRHQQDIAHRLHYAAGRLSAIAPVFWIDVQRFEGARPKTILRASPVSAQD